MTLEKCTNACDFSHSWGLSAGTFSGRLPKRAQARLGTPSRIAGPRLSSQNTRTGLPFSRPQRPPGQWPYYMVHAALPRGRSRVEHATNARADSVY
jgi:hypothetical protein